MVVRFINGKPDKNQYNKPTHNTNTTPQTQHPPLRRHICRGRLSVIVITITHSPQLDGPQLDDSDFTMDKPHTHRSSQGKPQAHMHGNTTISPSNGEEAAPIWVT
jgi:hypothetical protein